MAVKDIRARIAQAKAAAKALRQEATAVTATPVATQSETEIAALAEAAELRRAAHEAALELAAKERKALKAVSDAEVASPALDYRSPKRLPDGRIDCEVLHPAIGWVPFTASPDDPERHGRDLFAAISMELKP